MKTATAKINSGLLLGILGFIVWGIAPIYFKALSEVPAHEILSHRILWSVILLIFILAVGRRWAILYEILSSTKNTLLLILCSLLIGSNWFIYIWAIHTDQLLEASLGYYITPLMIILLAVIFLKERLCYWQVLAVTLATMGVLVQIFVIGKLPWMALALALTFSSYSLVRKYINVDTLSGLLIETFVLAPFAIYLLFVIESQTGNLQTNHLYLNILLLSAGIVTTLPLVLYGEAAARTNLTTLGFLQYIAPTLMWILAIFVYHEPFTYTTLLSFFFIWAGLLLFSLGIRRKAMQNG